MKARAIIALEAGWRHPMKHRAAICCVVLYALAGPASAGDCMRSGAGPQAVEGRISVLEATDAADRPETALILTPQSPTCLEAESPEDSVLDAGTVHVFSSDAKIHERLQGAVGETILVWGEPFAAHTAHHHAPIVMDVSKIGPE
jgi:hypothetical protein